MVIVFLFILLLLKTIRLPNILAFKKNNDSVLDFGIKNGNNSIIRFTVINKKPAKKPKKLENWLYQEKNF